MNVYEELDSLCRAALKPACRWLTDVAQVKSDRISPDENAINLAHRHWRGAIRGEYDVAARRWDFFCAMWHTGQAIKSLVLAHRALGDASLLSAAKLSAEFVGAERIDAPGDEDLGLILAYEDRPDMVGTSAILETVDGLFLLSDATGDERYRSWALAAIDWVARKAYLPGQGLFRDTYDPRKRHYITLADWVDESDPHPGRPLIDDGVFLTAHRLTGDARFRQIFFETADRLLADEQPAGNWIRYVPCNRKKGYIHPRHAYWWGRPMISAWQASDGDPKYLQCARRAAEWYRAALRHDGGIIRNTYVDFNTDSFGHATSGSACAAILFCEMIDAAPELAEEFREPLHRALSYCLNMQLRETRDPNLSGVILEKVLAPNGTDRHPFYIRDLGTIFFIQAAARLLLSQGKE